MGNPLSFDAREGYIWLNGETVDWQDAKTHVLNHGLHYASCVFEGLRVYDGIPFKLAEHYQRLHDSATILGFSIPYSVEKLCNTTLQLLEKQGVKNGYIRPFAWRGSEQMAILTTRSTTHVAIAAWEWASYFGDEAREKGLKLDWAKWKRPAPDTAPTASKAAGLYMICTMSKNIATQNGFDDALMKDYRGYIAEATGANFFMVVGDELHTPTPDCFLDGITRRTVIELAKKRGIKVVERHIKPEELGTASEAFLTGSAAEVTPIGSVADYQFTVGSITRQMMDDYTALVHNTPLQLAVG